MISVFGVEKPIIGALHFCPLLGYPDFSCMEFVLKKAIFDLRTFEEGGVDAIIIENNYDLPHRITVAHETVAAMTFLAIELRKYTGLPMGINVLWNDYEAALSIAKVAKLIFVRIPVFVDSVWTKFGDIYGKANEVITYRKRIQAEGIALLTDIQVKHAKMLNPNKTIGESAHQAVKAGSDGLVITGRWTGDAPNINELITARREVGSFPIIIGSGADSENIKVLMQYADGVIVSTSLKSGQYLSPEENRNLKDSHEVIDYEKVVAFVRAFQDITEQPEKE